MNFVRMKIHKLSPVPTTIEESQKIIDSKDTEIIENSIEDLEKVRLEKDEKAILNLVNTHSQAELPLVESLSIEQKTYQEALKNLLSLRNPETFEAVMLLFEYMNKNNSFEIKRLTGIELLKLAGSQEIRQKHRDKILRRIKSISNTTITVLNPEKSLKNYKNKKSEKGLVYKHFTLIKVSETVYSKRNEKLIVELRDIKFLPEYIEYIHKISRRYIPLETIRKIPKKTGENKTRHFLYKLCFKFAGMKNNQCELNLEECMNLGKFYNKGENSVKRKWKPIIKALEAGKQANLIDYHFIIKETEEQKQQIKEEDYKTIEKIIITRFYPLNAPQLKLPFEIEEKEPSKKPFQATF